MLHLLAAALLATVSAPAAMAAHAPPTYPFTWSAHDLAGPGADRLRAAARHAQFVLIGEQHHDRDTPLFTRALYAVLRREDGFSHLVVEQDPLGVEMALAPGRRGNAMAIAEGLKNWPTLLGFGSDQDLALLADAGAAEPGRAAIWGLEQAQSPVRYLEELVSIAPAGPVRADVDRLLARAQDEEGLRSDFGKFLAYDQRTLPELRCLENTWMPESGSRAELLLSSLIKSAEIYSYYTSAHAEHDSSGTYFNGTVREAWLKSQLTRDYRAEGGAPRALFKFGDNHIRRGVGSTGAWTLGTFVADLATFDSMEACGILVVAIGSNIPDWSHLPPELVPLLPSERPATPVLIDLSALRPEAEAYIRRATVEAREETRGVLFGFDAIVVLPDSAPATWRLTGFPAP